MSWNNYCGLFWKYDKVQLKIRFSWINIRWSWINEVQLKITCSSRYEVQFESYPLSYLGGIDLEGIDMGGIDNMRCNSNHIHWVILGGIDLEGIDMGGIDMGVLTWGVWRVSGELYMNYAAVDELQPTGQCNSLQGSAMQGSTVRCIPSCYSLPTAGEDVCAPRGVPQSIADLGWPWGSEVCYPHYVEGVISLNPLISFT